MIKWLKQNSPWLITVLCTLVSLVLWIVFQTHPNLTSLFINLTSGFFVSTFTICIIERILKKQKEQALLPLQLALYRDVQHFTSSVICLWEWLYVHSTENKDKRPINDLFSQETTDSIVCTLNLDQNMKVLPEMSIYEYIIYRNHFITDLGKIILERYNTTASPEVLQNIHYLISDSCLIGERLKDIEKTRTIAEKHKQSIAPYLKNFLISPTERDRQEILRLIDWCNKQYEELKDESKSIYKIKQEFGDTRKVYI